jgi:hypothetical protein
METHPYQQAFNRIRAEFSEMPGMILTAEQVRRLCGVDLVVCRDVLDDLVRAKFLASDDSGGYRRTGYLSRMATGGR